jgi:alpha-ketoglutarate-dependent taurine dioxygenase
VSKSLFHLANQLIDRAEKTENPVIFNLLVSQAGEYYALHPEFEKFKLKIELLKEQRGKKMESKESSNIGDQSVFIEQLKLEIAELPPEKFAEELKTLISKLIPLSSDDQNRQALEKTTNAELLNSQGKTEEAVTELESVREQVSAIVDKETPVVSKLLQQSSPKFISALQRAKIEPWRRLPERQFTIRTESFGGIEVEETLELVQRYGIALIRLVGHSPTSEVTESVFRLIGQAAGQQNDFEGEIKELKPTPGIEANTGSSAGDLGFHVDGTQAAHQPALLMFQYVQTADIGGNSRFVDMAKVLLDLDEETRTRLLLNLSAKDAATFSKKDMIHSGPIFNFPDRHSLACRLRYDDVVKLRDDCKEDFEFLKRITNDGYENFFKPLNGDIIVFDNWRIMHARTEIYGMRQRFHRRVWMDALNEEHQANYLLGIRPVPVNILAEIQKQNGA